MHDRYKSSSRINDGGGGGTSTLRRCKSQREHLLDQNLDNDENSLDLFSHNFSTFPNDSYDAGSLKSGKLSFETLKVHRRGIDDLFSSIEGKHDYDWLLTPPGSPLVSLLNEKDSQQRSASLENSALVRPASMTKSSRLSLSQSVSNYHSRARRSNSAPRISLSASHTRNYSSSSLVSSRTRTSSPVTRTTSGTRNVASSARSRSLSRNSTPSRSHPTSSIDNTTSPQNSRSSTPISRAQNRANLSSLAARFSSRTSTPARKRAVGCSSAPSSRPSSPASRPHQQPVILPDFSFDTPPNLKTSLLNRPLSAGRYRPGAAFSVKVNSDMPEPINMPKRMPSPIFRRARVIEPLERGHRHDSGLALDASELSGQAVRKHVKYSTNATESIGLGRNISKISLDMAMRHMDMRSVTGSSRLLSGATVFPQSIRSASAVNHSIQVPDILASISAYDNEPASKNEFTSDADKHSKRSPENKAEEDGEHPIAKLSEEDDNWSSHYDSIFLEEDLKDTMWLHSVDGDEEPIFDNGIEPLPEPFDHL